MTLIRHAAPAQHTRHPGLDPGSTFTTHATRKRWMPDQVRHDGPLRPTPRHEADARLAPRGSASGGVARGAPVKGRGAGTSFAHVLHVTCGMCRGENARPRARHFFDFFVFRSPYYPPIPTDWPVPRVRYPRESRMPLASHASDGPVRPFAKAMEVIWVRMMGRGLVFHSKQMTGYFILEGQPENLHNAGMPVGSLTVKMKETRG